MRLLLVEDETDFATPLCKLLHASDYAVDHALNAEDAEEFLFSTPYDALLLDVNLPKKSGLELLNQLRAQGNTVPVLMLTARDTTQQKIEGLNTGADDYLVKPFEFDELLARLQALIRRSNRRASPSRSNPTIHYISPEITKCWNSPSAISSTMRLNIPPKAVR